MSSPEEWGCPLCRGVDSKVSMWGRDEDGYIVRIRDCTRPGCHGRFATEERIIELGAFYTRDDLRNTAQKAHYRKGPPRTCPSCGMAYAPGTYHAQHLVSPFHVKALREKANEAQRRYKRRRAERKPYEKPARIRVRISVSDPERAA